MAPVSALASLDQGRRAARLVEGLVRVGRQMRREGVRLPIVVRLCGGLVPVACGAQQLHRLL